MKRLLVIGAGASLEECEQSGNYPNDDDKKLPLISNFCNKLFIPSSQVLIFAISSYLDYYGINYDSKT